MSNSKTNNSSKKSNSVKKTSTSKKTNTVKKTNNKSTIKSTSKKKTTNTKNNSTKKVSTNKKNIKTNSVNTNIVDNINGFSDEINVSKLDDNNITKEEKVEKEIIEEINNVKLENSKYIKKKKSNLKFIGVFISLLGIIALIISLVANRIIDREFLSDTTISIMLIISILIECFGAFIIINES